MSRGEPPSRTAPVRPGDVIAEKYLVVRVVAAGGMGVVVAARHRQLGRMVAIKLLREGMGEHGAAHARFELEARIVAGLTGEHVAQVFDVGRLPTGEPFIVMELLEGETLADRLQRAKKLSIADALRFVLQACEGLAEAHAAGIVHRDLKPGNLFIERRLDGSESLKILDFGISKTRETTGSLTHTLDLIGTPAYMAPEQLESAGTVDARADVWSLGAVLYEALSGHLPFPVEGVVKIVSAVILSEPVPLHTREPVLPPELVEVVHRCLKKAADERFASVLDLAQALAPLAGEGTHTLSRIAKLSEPRSLRSLEPALDATESGNAALLSGGLLEDAPPSHNGPRASTRMSAVTSHPRSLRSNAPPLESRRRVLLLGAAAGAALVSGGGYWFARRGPPGDRDDSRGPSPGPMPAPASDASPSPGPLRVGVLHSLTGTMAASEAPLVDAALLAIERVNDAGGLLGRRVEALVRDGHSRAETFLEQSRRLLDDDAVPAVFGCWTSTSRRAVRPLYEERKKLLLYSVQYEGIEASPSVLYFGAAPNQQLIPAVRWAYAFLARKSAFLVGSDYVFPRVATEILKDELRSLGGTVAGEAFLPLGTTDVSDVVQRIKKSGATLILNTINGDTNVAFVRALRAAGVTSAAVPTLSFSLDQSGYRDLDPSLVAGDYMAWNYFESFDSDENRAFLKALHERVGPRPATDPMATTYSAVLFWAEAVRRAGSVELAAVRGVLGSVHVATPLGDLRVTPANGHAVKTVAIGQISGDGDVKVVWYAPEPVEATPYPSSRSREDWEKLLTKLQKDWGGRWERPQ